MCACPHQNRVLTDLQEKLVMVYNAMNRIRLEERQQKCFRMLCTSFDDNLLYRWPVWASEHSAHGNMSPQRHDMDMSLRCRIACSLYLRSRIPPGPKEFPHNAVSCSMIYTLSLSMRLRLQLNLYVSAVSSTGCCATWLATFDSDTQQFSSCVDILPGS